MEYLTLEQQLFEKQQKGENTDCSFVFKIRTEDGKMTAKVLYGHKSILSTASKYFEANFKDEWNGTSPIVITTFDWEIFDKLMRAIYLREITFDGILEAINIYEAAHFYQMHCVLELLRDEIIYNYLDYRHHFLSDLAKTAWNYQDYKLMPFVVKYFCANTQILIKSADFMDYPTEVINWLFQYEDLSANETDLVKALEKYLETNVGMATSMIRPAIEKIRFLAIDDPHFGETTLLTQAEKDFLLGKPNVNVVKLSKSERGRKVKTFYSRLPPEIQFELTEKVFGNKCWYCETYDHDVVDCDEVKATFPVYSRLRNFPQHFSSCSAKQILWILREFHKLSASQEFAAFAKVDEIWKNPYIYSLSMPLV
ncbi:uncharacterized protein LOC134838165 [Culicoides brevitarsis]|uniref:uncharacterized protein LOC134838165 n=1 Tax=Culicoides brevitarsis TaxID=469753 RepID=UPI00307C3E15